MSIYTSGNAAAQPRRRTEEVPDLEERRRQNAKARKAARIRAHELKVAAQKRRLRAAAYTAAGAVVLGICMLMLSAVIQNNNLSSEISTLEAELEELTAQNDSREYEIDSSVDLNDIIETATEELGMVRSTADQIITYSESDSEYVQQVAEIPDE